MQKTTRKRSETSNSYDSRPTRKYPVPVPEVINIDDLSTMLDEDMMARLRDLEEGKTKVYEAYMDAQPWEEEVAYIRREQQIRRVRRDIHSDYLKKSENEFNASEFHLPAGDFDNSIFVYAATGGRPKWN